MTEYVPTPKLTVHLYGNLRDWELPSFDPFSLSILAYLKFATQETSLIPPTIEICNNPHMSVYKNLPLLVNDTDAITGTKSIFSYLQDKGFPLQKLLPYQEAETNSFIILVEEKLHKLLLYNWWFLPENSTEVAKLPHFNVSCFPLNILLPLKKKDEIKLQLSEFASMDKYSVHENADALYKCLSDRLGDQLYFYGDSPSCLDAVVYAHLMVHLKSPLPSANLLIRHLKKYPNLHKFCSNISLRYWGEEEDFELDIDDEEDKKEKEELLKMNKPSKIGLYLVGLGFAFIAGQYMIQKYRS